MRNTLGRTRNPWARLLIFAAVLAAFLGSYHLGNRHKAPEQTASVAVLVNRPLDLPAFKLTDAAGNPFARNDLAGYWTLMLFCAGEETALRRGTARLADVYNRLASAPQLQARVLLVPVATEEPAAPEGAHDTPASPWHLLTGPAAEVAGLQKQLGLGPSRPAADVPGGDGDVLLLIDPKARLYAIYTADLGADAVARDLEHLADRYATEAAHNDALPR